MSSVNSLKISITDSSFSINYDNKNKQPSLEILNNIETIIKNKLTYLNSHSQEFSNLTTEQAYEKLKEKACSIACEGSLELSFPINESTEMISLSKISKKIQLSAKIVKEKISAFFNRAPSSLDRNELLQTYQRIYNLTTPPHGFNLNKDVASNILSHLPFSTLATTARVNKECAEYVKPIFVSRAQKLFSSSPLSYIEATNLLKNLYETINYLHSDEDLNTKKIYKINRDETVEDFSTILTGKWVGSSSPVQIKINYEKELIDIQTKIAKERLMNPNEKKPLQHRLNAHLNLEIDRGNYDRIISLLALGADVNGIAGGNSPLELALENTKGSSLERNKIIQLLLEKGAKVDAIYGGSENTALHIAAGRGDLEVLKLLLSQPNSNLGIKNAQNLTPLEVAYANGHLETVEYLENIGDRLTRVIDGENSCFIAAANNGKLEAVRLLLNQGWESIIDWKNKDDETALSLAIAQGHREVADLLIANHADVATPLANGKTCQELYDEKFLNG